MINIEGKLIEKFETVQITETFKKREFVLEYIENPEYPEFIKIELIQDKCDLIDKEEIKIKKNILENETQLQVYTISTITGEGVSNLINHILIIKN